MRKEENELSYTPVGESSPVRLTIDMVRRYLTSPTRSGKQPSDAEVVKFMMLCKSRGLNPWVGDAYLVGYDGKDGPQFSLITAHQALLKRAEMSDQYDGIESGVIVAAKDGTITERQGDMMYPGETLLGGWARVYRRDRGIPCYDSLNLKVYDSGRSQWSRDPAGMIVKCAEASVLRKAFPSMCGGLYTQGEMDIAARVASVPAAEPHRVMERPCLRLEDIAEVSLSAAAEAVAETVEGERESES